MKIMIVYHAHCIDGITAATVVVKFLVEKCEVKSEDIVLQPMTYDDSIPGLHDAIIAEHIERLYVVDFSFSVPVLMNLYTLVDAIELYDHHASAFRNLMEEEYQVEEKSKENFFLSDNEGRPTNIHIVLDNNECGASLCYKWLLQAPDTFNDVAEQNLPNLIKFVKDYDLWRFKLGYTKPLNKFLKQLSKDIVTYTALLISFEDDNFLNNAFNQGESLLDYENKIEDELIEQGVTPITIDGVDGLCCNAPYAFASNIGHKLALRSHSFGAIWTQQAGGKVVFSLRSNEDECDVSKLAEVMGGGGHKNAAGFTFLSPNYDEQKGITLWSETGADVTSDGVTGE